MSQSAILLSKPYCEDDAKLFTISLVIVQR